MNSGSHIDSFFNSAEDVKNWFIHGTGMYQGVSWLRALTDVQTAWYWFSGQNLMRTEKDIKALVAQWCSLDNEQEKLAFCKEYGHIKDWNVLSVYDMTGLFENCTNFNDDISQWDVSRVNKMERMFCGAEKFNQPIGCWDTSNVESFNGMFSGASSFNQPLNWCTILATSMKNMFKNAVSFNQNLIYSSQQGFWNTKVWIEFNMV
jgi:surface protein